MAKKPSGRPPADADTDNREGGKSPSLGVDAQARGVDSKADGVK